MKIYHYRSIKKKAFPLEVPQKVDMAKKRESFDKDTRVSHDADLLNMLVPVGNIFLQDAPH